MRKRIPCKIIRSVPLYRTDEGLQSQSGPGVHESLGADPVTYSRRIVITRTCPDEASAAQRFDLCA
ncbi:MAG: hypothetical protein ACYS6W_18320 [Planctomycetota bacterium]